jgi:hypothetical protein
MPAAMPSHQLVGEYQASCAVAGYEERPCARHVQCILGELSKESGILIAASRHELTSAQSPRWEIPVDECRAKTLPPAGASGIAGVDS